ncbi:MAG: CRISPR-associated helicase Cas3' [Rubrobacteraceae bacterium]|nr:CRISPR-associated helicase Cas3' [Rubrobacteraceae bacterium]
MTEKRAQEFLSHPDKLLSEHVAEVREAARSILRLHAPDPAREQLISDIVSLHDLGKASPAFQEYIRAPEGYRGERNKKAHTPVGFAVTLLLGDGMGRDPFWTLCVAAAVLGHHSGFPNDHRLTDHFLLDDEWAEIIEEQAAGIPAREISELTSFSLEEILGNPGLCDDAYDVAERLIESLREKASNDLRGAVADRLKMQFAFSVLLEADKAFLVLSADRKTDYRSVPKEYLPPTLVNDYLRGSGESPINALRSQAREETLKKIRENPHQRLWTLALPTGLGKTLTAASLALSLREAAASEGRARRIFVVLPFLSIIDQTAQVYGELLGHPPPSTLMQSHSLSERIYDTENERDAEFFLDTWNSEIVITTFDQFLLSLFDDRTRYQMRFHNLADAVLVFDEVQTLPTQLWDPLDHALQGLTQHLNSTAILMSATQPGFVTGTENLIEDPTLYYRAFGRYRLSLKHKRSMTLNEFAESLLARQNELEEERVLITLNTRASARDLWKILYEEWKTPIHLLSADITPKDRLAVIEKIKSSRDPCLVVSTQVIEAGVDIDMGLVMRDFAPLDSLIQVAGRCNRNGAEPRKDVEIYHLTNDAHRPFAEMVYTVGRGSPDVRLDETRSVLEPYDSILEEDVLCVCEEYFSRLRSGKNLGSTHTLNWASLAKQQPNIQVLLRGERDCQVRLIVAERDEGDLQSELEEALKIKDRWERRRSLRKLAGRIARVTVSVWARNDWHPGEIAEPIGNYNPDEPYWRHPWWIVRPGNYDPETGLILEGDIFV